MPSLTLRSNSNIDKKQKKLSIQYNRKAIETFRRDQNAETEDEVEDENGPGFELSGDVAVYRDGAESKLSGLLRVQCTKIPKLVCELSNEFVCIYQQQKPNRA